MTASETPKLTAEERASLLKLARDSIEAATANQPLPRLDWEQLSPKLRLPGASFVTLYQHGELRGCTGTLVARYPLAQEVVQTAAQTALYDPRFLPVASQDMATLEIEISILTPPQKLRIESPEDLPRQIRPGVDGVTLYKGPHRATFLPQVWQKIHDPIEFLDMLSKKMGLPPKSWLTPGMEVEVYQVEEFSEKDLAEA